MKAILNNETLKLARTYLGLNQKQFAEIAGVSQAQISSVEKSRKPLTKELVENLKLKFGDSFFSQNIVEPNLKVHYRASATVAKKYTDLFESRLYLISNNISKAIEYVDLPDNNIPKFDLEDCKLDAEYLANEIRGYFNLGRKPIDNIVRLLESKGVIVYFFDYDFITAQNKNFDGVSFYVKGVPVILINNKIQGARKIFTLAHELAHLIMHNHSDFIISKYRDLEKEANIFASEFLAPKAALRGELTNLTFNKLFTLKSYWKISAAALLYKAKEMYMSKDQYRRWITKMAPYRKSEPNDLHVDSPILIKKIFTVLKEELGDEEFYNEMGMSKKIFQEIYSTLNETKRTKLKII